MSISHLDPTREMNNNKQNGFTLLEVMITLIIANIALLGLVAGQLKSLQYANNSFQYTLSLIQASNVVERIYNDICVLQDGRQSFDENYITNTLTTVDGYTLGWAGTFTAGGPFVEDFTINISWEDQRMIDQTLNQVSINAHFPKVTDGCSV